MDARDRKLLNEVQSDFPVSRRPYRVIGDKIGMDEQEVLKRIGQLREQGIIRRLGASINSRRVGYVSTLLAANVPPEKLDLFVNTVNACEGVTHNYQRKHLYNIWFTLISQSEETKRKTIDSLKAETGVDIVELPAKKIFKIRVDFKF